MVSENVQSKMKELVDAIREDFIAVITSQLNGELQAKKLLQYSFPKEDSKKETNGHAKTDGRKKPRTEAQIAASVANIAKARAARKKKQREEAKANKTSKKGKR